MKIIILTAKCGMGHYSVAKTLKEELEMQGNQAEIVDFYELIFPKLNKLIYAIFNSMVSKFGRIYNFFYKFSANSNFMPLRKVIAKKLENLLGDKEIKIVISTFPVCSNYASAYKKYKRRDLKLYTYITDVDVNKEWITPETDMYCVASILTKRQLESYNINSEKILITGIPVKNEFKTNIINRYKKIPEILIMGGGLGLFHDTENVLKELIKNKNIHITLIAGKNKKIFDKYINKYENLTVIGYTNTVYNYMKKADLIVTKPGGITVFEAINSKTPIYALIPFLSQEIGNAKFIERNGIGLVAWENTNLSAKNIISLVNSEKRLANMKQNMSRIINTFESNIFANIEEEKVVC